MLKCPNCNSKSNKVEIQTTEIGTVRWLEPKIIDAEIDLGKRWVYEGGFTDEEKGYTILCKKCGEVIKEIE